MMSGLLSTTAKSSIRPPMAAGPISRNFSALNASLGSAASAVVATRKAKSILFIGPKTLLRSLRRGKFIEKDGALLPALEHLQLPEVVRGVIEDRRESQLAGLADALLYVTQLGELAEGFRVGVHRETALAKHEH